MGTSEGDSKKRSRLSRDDSRAEILKQSLKLMNELGWSGLTFQLIGKRCGMSPSNIVYHFQNRESLLRGLLLFISENNWRIVNEGLTNDLDAFERLVAHFETNHNWAREFPQEAQVILQIYTEAVHDKEFSAVFCVMVERAQSRIKDLLLAGKREGLMRAIGNADHASLMARVLHNLLMGSCIYATGGQLTSPLPLLDWSEALKPLVGYRKRSG